MTIDSVRFTIQSITQREFASLGNMDGGLLVACLVDSETLQPLFDESDVEQLSEMDASWSIPLQRACIEHCGVGVDFGETVKNSEATAGSGG